MSGLGIMEERQTKKLSFSFLPIPEELMKSKALSFGAKFLFGVIAKANRETVRWSVNYLSKRMNCSSRETTRRIAELKKNNLIIVVPRKGRVNEYLINFELIQIIQTPVEISHDQTVVGQNGLMGPDNSGRGCPDRHSHPNSKEHSLKKINKEDGVNKNFINESKSKVPQVNFSNSESKLFAFKKAKIELIKAKSMPYTWQTEAQEEASAQIRPSGLIKLKGTQGV